MAYRYDYAQAQHNIKQLQAALGLENYNAWYAQAVSEFDNWMTVDLKVQGMLACIARSEDETDHHQTLNDARGF